MIPIFSLLRMYTNIFQQNISEIERHKNEIKVTIKVPKSARSAVIGRKGATVRSIQDDTKTLITSPSQHGDPIFTIRGYDQRQVDSAKRRIEQISARFPRDRSRSPIAKEPKVKKLRYGGKLPSNWLQCPEKADALVDDFILAVKCPLHENFTKKVISYKYKPWRLKELWDLEEDYGKKVSESEVLPQT